jgi:alpha-tubulin suppressor-like RCC1 family protein
MHFRVGVVLLAASVSGCGARTSLDALPTSSTTSGVFVASVVAGQSHACARINGVLQCWGGNSSGQVGDGTVVNRLIPVVVEHDVSGIAAGDAFSAALLQDGRVEWWGSMRMTDSHVTTVLTPTLVSASQSQIFARGSTFDMFLRDATGHMRCWGTNNYTFGIADPTSTPAVTLTPIDCTNFDTAVDVATSEAFSCGLWPSGQVKCTGDNTHGQLGNGSAVGPSAIPQEISGIKALSISAGGAYACAVLENTTIDCWGINGAGQLGDGTNVERHWPVPVLQVADARRVAASAFHTCAVVSGGGVMCWGRNDEGELGDGTTVSSNIPVAVVGLSDVKDIALGSYFSCAQKADTTVWCWGANDSGQLGDGTTLPHAIPALLQMTK